MAGNEIAVESPAKSPLATQTLLDMPILAVEIPVTAAKVEQLLKIAGVIGVNFPAPTRLLLRGILAGRKAGRESIGDVISACIAVNI